MKSSLKFLGLQLLEQNLNQLAFYTQRYKSRKVLLKLDEDVLKDIGISKEQAEEEAKKPFWEGDIVKTKQGLAITENKESRLVSNYPDNNKKYEPVKYIA